MNDETGSMNIKETAQFWKDAFSDMPGAGDVASAVGSDMSRWGRGLSDKVSKKLTDMRHIYDDNIVVPEGTLTMTGKDFSVLYGGMSSVSGTEDTAGNGMSEIKSDTWYDTEMLSANLNSTSGRRTIDTLTPEQRAAYEVVLLTKGYAAQYSPGASASNDAAAQAYADEMVEYRRACEDSGVSWPRVMTYASWEFQTQSLEYREDTKGIIDPESSEKNRVLSNRAHSMLVECGPDGWSDTLLPHLGGRITYEETLDTNERDVAFYKNIGAWFKDKWDKLVNVVTSPWRALKSAVPGLIDTADNIIAAGDAQHEINKRDYENTLLVMQGRADEIKETASDLAGTAADKAKDLAGQAAEYFGLTDDGAPEQENERQAGE